MIRSLRAAMVAALILAVAAPAFGGEHSLTYDEALARAKEHGKVVVIDFFADWCGPCKAFDRDLANAESGIATALEAVVFTSIDAEKGDGIELAKKYGVSGFPTYTMMNAEGELIESWVGYGGPGHFIGAFDTALADPTTLEQKRERFASAPTAEHAKQLGRIAATAGQYEEGMNFLFKAEELDPELDASVELLDASFTRARKDPNYSYADFIEFADERVLKGDVDPESTVSTTYYVGRVTANEEDHATVKPFLVKSREVMAAPDVEVSKGLANAVELQAIIILDQDMDKAVAFKRTTMPEGWMENPDQLNSFAWWCFENDVNLEEAQQLALKGVELADPGQSRAQILDTAAEICNALGNCDEAIALIRRAIEEEPASEYYAEQLARFEEAAAAE